MATMNKCQQCGNTFSVSQLSFCDRGCDVMLCVRCEKTHECKGKAKFDPDALIGAPALISAPKATAPNPAQNGYLSGRRQRFLDAAATLTTLNAEVTRETVSAWVGVHPRGGSVGEELKALADAGYLTNDRGKLTVTKAGHDAAGFIDPALAIESARAGLSARQARFFSFVVGKHPDGVTREDVGKEFDLHPRGGSLGEDLGRLVGRGLVEVDRGVYRARDFLFAGR